MNNTIKKVMICLISVVLVATLTLPANAIANGIGTESVNSKTELSGNVIFEKIVATDSELTRNVNRVSFDLSGGEYVLMPFFGDSLLSRHTLTQMAALAEKQGYEVVAAVNGDFFFVEGDTPTGMPRGAMIRNNVIIATEDYPPNITPISANDWQTIGFKENGNAVNGHFTTFRTITMHNKNGTVSEVNFTALNRVMFDMGVQIYTSDFGSNVGNSLYPAYTITLSVVSGTMSLGSTVYCTVDSITESQKNVPLKAGKIYITAPVNFLNDESVEEISSAYVGQAIDIRIDPQDDKWLGVTQAISGPNSVVSDGTVTTFASAIPQNYPSSLIGVTSAGKAYMVQIDGRNMGGSYGVGTVIAGQYMKSLGCSNALLFDGGGSSEMIIKNSSGKFEVANLPSDGNERSVGTSLLIVKRTSKNTTSLTYTSTGIAMGAAGSSIASMLKTSGKKK